MKKKDKPIGIFDSGIGGLTVVKEIIRELPNEEIIYFGDTARLPYGNKSAPTVVKFSIENAKFLLKFGVKFIIVACNTSSSLAVNRLKEMFSVPVLGVISPAVTKAVEISQNGRIGIIGTRATVESMCYQREIKKIKPSCKTFARPCPLFVPLAEEGWLRGEVTFKIAQTYLQPFFKKDIDTFILGCTHYPLLTRVIAKVLGKKIKFVDSAKETAREAKRILTKNGLCAEKNSHSARCKFYVSDEPTLFRKTGRRFLGKNIKLVQKVD